MATINRTFSVKNGIDVANTIIVDSSRNLSNIATINATTINANTVLTSTGVNVSAAAINAYGAANAAANSVWVYANGGSILSGANLNFNNTATVNVSATANGSGQVNVTFSANTTAIAAAGPQGPRGAGFWTPQVVNVTQSATDSTVFNKTGGVNGTQTDAKFYSLEGFTRGCYVTYQVNDVNAVTAVGLNESVTSSVSINSIDYAFLTGLGSTLSIYESGSSVYSGSFISTDVFTITYDGTNVRYYKNGTLLRTVARTVGNPLQLDSSLSNTNTGVQNLHFGPMGEAGPIGGSNTQINFNNNGSAGGSANLTFNLNQNLFAVGTTTLFANATSGYVGVGTTSPNSNITVVGNIWATTGVNTATVNATTINVNSVLTSTGINVSAAALSAYGAANSGANTVRVSQNSSSTLSSKQLNFINTASITATVTDSGDGNANISFITTGASSGQAYDAANAAGNLVAVYANNTLAMANANINYNNTATMNVLVTANATNKAANVELSANLSAIGIPSITGALGTMNTSISVAGNTVAIYANNGLVLANGNVAFVNTATANASVTANGNFGANIGFTPNTSGMIAVADFASGANSYAQTAYGAANSGANTVWVYKDGTSVLSKSNLNFNTSPTMNVTVAANGSTQSNIQYNINTTGLLATTDLASGANGYAQTVYTAANTYANLVAVYANGALVMANANVNFNNTATMNLSVTANGTNKAANIEYSANLSAIGIPSITSGLATMNTNITVASNLVAVYANGTLAMANANVNFNNTSTMNVLVTANGTNKAANVELNANLSAIGITSITGALGTMNTNITTVYTQANASANLVAVYANNTLAMANANINYNNTATMNVLVTANATNKAANVELSANLTSIGIPSITGALGTMNTNITNTNSNAINAYAKANSSANSVWVYANGASIVSNANVNFIDSSSANATVTANGTTQANISFVVNTRNLLTTTDFASGANSTAQTAYIAANNSNLLSGGTITGDLQVTGNIYLGTGNVSYINVTSVSVNDSIIYLAANNIVSDVLDIGFVGHYYNTAQQNVHTGIIRHAADKKYYIFDGYAPEPGNNVIDVSVANVATLVANIQSNYITLGGSLVGTAANIGLAYDQANTARTNANTGITNAGLAYDAANNRVLRAGDAMTGNLTITTTGIGLTVANANITYSLQVGSLNVTTNTVTTAAAGQVVLDTFPVTQLSSAKYFVQANSATTYHTTEMVLVQDQTNIYITEYGSVQTGASLGTFSADITGGNARLLFTAVNNVNTIKSIRYGVP